MSEDNLTFFLQLAGDGKGTVGQKHLVEYPVSPDDLARIMQWVSEDTLLLAIGLLVTTDPRRVGLIFGKLLERAQEEQDG